MKGCAIYAVAAVAAFIFSLIMLFAMASGGGAAAGTPVLDATKVPADYLQWVKGAGAECSTVSAPLIAAQIQQESGWDPKAESHDAKGNPIAQGIAQFTPDTWPHWGQDENSDGSASVWDPPDAIMAMGRYDCAIAKQVAGVPGDPIANMLAGYNAGPDSVLQAHGVPQIAETQQYVASIEALITKYELALSGGSAFAQNEIASAEKYIGTPYVWGGGSTSGPTSGGFDCSGLVLYAVFQASGGKTSLPHSSEVQATMGQEVQRSDLQPGDVIAIQTVPGDYSHIVIYIGAGQIVEAPKPGRDVRTAPLSEYDGMTQTIRRFG
jgi:cell wall-associated NlpC family hydrolase